MTKSDPFLRGLVIFVVCRNGGVGCGGLESEKVASVRIGGTRYLMNVFTHEMGVRDVAAGGHFLSALYDRKCEI